MKLFGRFMSVLLLMCVVTVHAQDVQRTMVSYVSGDKSFEGYLYKPDGDGPFPAVIWNSGHKNRLLKTGPVKAYDALAKIYVDDGYVFFVPDRHVHQIEDDEYSRKLQNLIKKQPNAPETKRLLYEEYLEVNARDVSAALKWLRSKPYVKSDRVALSGWSSGGAVALIAAEEDPKVRACVLFSPGISQWKDKDPLRQRLIEAAGKCQAATFIIQGSNDPTMEPGNVLGKKLKQNNTNSRVKVYPYSQESLTQPTCIAIVGWNIWGYDVLTYLEPIMKGD